jgi:hypothetical protein
MSSACIRFSPFDGTTAGSEPVELPFMKFNDFGARTCVSSTGALLLDKVARPPAKKKLYHVKVVMAIGRIRA